MALTTVNNIGYTIPELGDRNWGQDVTNLLEALGNHKLDRAGGLFTIGSELNFGVTAGIAAICYKPQTGISATTGLYRLQSTDSIAWRNGANTLDLSLIPSSDTVLSFGGVDLLNLSDSQTLLNKTIEVANNVITTAASGGLTSTELNAALAELQAEIEHANKQIPYGQSDGLGLTSKAGFEYDEATDTLTVPNLTVTGTQTSVNTTILETVDPNITVNKGGDDASSEGAGLTIERTGVDGSLIYEDALASKFKLGALGSEAEIVDVSSSQTLTNKTLTSPVMTGITVDAVSLDGAKIVETDKSQTLTNKTITDPQIDASIILDQIATPSNPAAGDIKLYQKSDGKLYTLDESGNELAVGSGASGGDGNYVINSNAESGVVSDVTASGSVSVSSEEASPLIGLRSFLLTASGATGGTVDYALNPIDAFYEGRELEVSMLLSTSTTAGTFKVGVHDGTQYVVDADISSGKSKYRATFVPVNGATYTVRIEDVSGAAAETVIVDNVSVKPLVESDIVNPQKNLEYSSGAILVSSMGDSSAEVIVHNTNVPAIQQVWSGVVVTTGGDVTPLGDFVVDDSMTSTQVTINVSDQLGTSSVYLYMEDKGFLGASSSARYYDTGDLTAADLDALLPISHNLPTRPSAATLQVEVSAGEWEEHDWSAYITASDSSLTSTGTTLASVLGGATNVRLIVGNGQSALSVAPASATQSGVVTTEAQTIAGAKTFQDGISGPGSIPLGSIVAIASNITGSHTIPATGTVDADGFQYCDGAAIDGSAIMSGTMPDLTDDRFLMGSTVAGNTGGSNVMLDHTHTSSLTYPNHSHSNGTLATNTATSVASSNHIHELDGRGTRSFEAGNGWAYTNGGSILQSGQNFDSNAPSSTTSLNNIDIDGSTSTDGGGSVSGSIGTGSAPSSTDSRPQYLTVQYIMRVK